MPNDSVTLIKTIAGALAGLTLLSGLIAANLWYRSAATGLDVQQIRTVLAADEAHERLAVWLAEGANLNKWAAIWTAISVVAGALCTAIDHMA